MGRQIVDTILSTRNARRNLKRGPKPYWRLIAHGRHIGYRRSQGGGAWIARLYLGDGKYAEKRIGTADDITDADGVEVLTWAQAQQKAHAWFVACQREAKGLHPDPNHEYTVKEAIDAYLAWYEKHRKSYADTKAYADAHIVPALGHIKLSRLRREIIEDWHTALATMPPRRRTKPGKPQNFGPEPQHDDQLRSRKVTANRVLTILKAAFNKAKADKNVSDSSAWDGVKRFEGVDSARAQFLDHNEAPRLINASDPVFRPLVQAALLTGARYGELCNLKVGDFKHGKLFISKSKSSESRWIMLNSEGKQFFEQVVLGRDSNEPMFVKNGKPWGKSHQIDYMKRACANAGVNRMGFHQLRHSYASMAVMSGLPLIVLAENLGHVDTRMVERFYGHLVLSYKEQMIEKFAPTLGIVWDQNVVSMPVKK